MSDTGISKEMLREILAQNAEMLKELVTEMKKPTVIEQREIEKQDAAIIAKQEERQRNAAGRKQRRENNRQRKLGCTHEHAESFGSMVNTHCVHVKTSGPGSGLNGNALNSDYILCQKCQAQIKPGPAPTPRQPGDNFIYDTALFNKLFAKVSRSGDIFG